MKNTEKYLLYLTLAGLALLYILHFTGSDQTEEAVEITADTLQTEIKGEKTGRIYYVNTDTVWSKYDYVQEITSVLEKKKIQYEGQMERELRNFEREVTEFREKGPLMSEVEVQIKQRDLVRKEQELAQLREELEIKFLQEEKEWNDKLRKSIVDFIDESTQERSYDYVLGYSITSNIILANDSLDLTEEIVLGLNTKYAAEKKQSAE